MRWPLIALMISGCGFSIDAAPAGGDDAPDPGPEVDGGTVIPRMCSTTDQDLRLCIDFDDETNLAGDGSLSALPVDAANLRPEPRASENAVLVNGDSHIWVPESDQLDIREDLTVSMWIKADVGVALIGNRWLYDNNTQYFASQRVDGSIRCGSGTRTTDSPPIPLDGRWHHVACTYEDDEMRVYVDGRVENCETFSDREIPTGGIDGFAVGANLSTIAGTPRFAEQFVGGIDNVQVFARIVPSDDLCRAATGGVGCATSCP